ncbi:MAG: sigma 54-interacting transcriptional regulator [Deltaproteobacteria bacterium]|nr:sigma 54-interacting transcriptional regulator [Deltaproteobacteria bacterium]
MSQGRHDFNELPEGDGVLVLSPEQVILAATLQAERLLKRRLEPGHLLPLSEIVAEPHFPQLSQAFQETLTSGAMRGNLLAQIRLASESAVFLKYSLAPLYSRNREITGVILTFHDDALTRTRSDWSGLGLGVVPEGLLESFDRGLFVVNSRRLLTAFNRMAQEITGYSRDEVLGRYCWEVFQADRCKTGCLLQATMEDGVSRTGQAVRIRHKEGRWLKLLISTAAIRNKRDMIVGGMEAFESVETVAPQPQELTSLQEVEIIGRSPALKRLLKMLPDVAASEANVILEGESGTGKDLLAQAIHLKSPRARGPFVAFSCSALVETLIESELFGHVKGAFTGAVSSKAGRFELARGGTLFLDEIGELKPELQIKLLRVLETRVFERVGSTKPIPLEARIIAATSRNLHQEVRQGRFRMDLLYRLRTVPFTLPPLRERPEDIPLLVNHCLAKLSRKYGKQVRGVDPKVMTLFQQYSWPGNIRELERVLEYALVFVKGAVITQDLLPDLEIPRPRAAPGEGVTLEQHRLSGERLTIQKALEKAQGRRDAAARLLGISRSSLWRKMKAYGLL